LESRVSKKAPFAPRTKIGTTVWDQPKVVNGKVFTMPEYSSLEDPHLTDYFSRKMGAKPKLGDVSTVVYNSQFSRGIFICFHTRKTKFLSMTIKPRKLNFEFFCPLYY